MKHGQIRKSRRGQAGLSLVEVMVSTSLVAISLVGTVASITSANALSQTTRETRVAAHANTAILEQVRATPIDNLIATFDQQQFYVPHLHGGDEDGAASVNVRQLVSGSTRWRVFEVSVEIRWNAAGSERLVRQLTYVSDRGYGTPGAVTETEAVASYDAPPTETTTTTTNDPGTTNP